MAGACAGLLYPTFSLALIGALGLIFLFRQKHPEPTPHKGIDDLKGLLIGTVAGVLAASVWIASRASLDPSAGSLIATGFLFTSLFLVLPAKKSNTAFPGIALAGLLWLGLLIQGLLPEGQALLLSPEKPLYPSIWVLQAGLMLAPVLIFRIATPRDQHIAPSLAGLGLGIGFTLFLETSAYMALLLILSLCGLSLLLLSQSLRKRFIGGAFVALSITSIPNSNPGWALGLNASWEIRKSHVSALSHLQDTESWTRRNNFLKSHDLIKAQSTIDGAYAIFQSKSGDITLELDGQTYQSNSSSADTHRLLPHLASALHAAPKHALVLGDPLGLVTEGLVAQGLEQIWVANPVKEATRALDSLNPELQRTLRAPTVRQIHGAPPTLLRQSHKVDLILELSRTPWADSFQGLPNEKGFLRRKSRLRTHGIYALALDLKWLTKKDLRQTLHDFSNAFSQRWTFLHPKGANHVALIGWQRPDKIAWSRFLESTQNAPELLANLSISSPLDLADLAICGPNCMASIGEQTDQKSRLWPQKRAASKEPTLPIFLPHLEEDFLFENEEKELIAVLKERKRANAAYLNFLTHSTSGRMDKALQDIKSLGKTESGLRKLDPLIQPYINRARIAVDRARQQGALSTGWEQAKSELNNAIALNPRSADAHALLGDVHLALGQLSWANKSFKRALELQPGMRNPLVGLSEVALRRKDLPAAESNLRKAIAAHPKDWLVTYRLGVFLSERGLNDEAEDLLRKAITLSESKEPAPHRAMAQLYLSRGEATAALIEAHRALSLEKSAINAHIVGKAYFEVEQIDTAAQYFRRAVLADPNFWQARGGMGLIYIEQSDWKRCVETFEQILLIAPNNQPATENLALCKAEIEP